MRFASGIFVLLPWFFSPDSRTPKGQRWDRSNESVNSPYRLQFENSYDLLRRSE